MDAVLTGTPEAKAAENYRIFKNDYDVYKEFLLAYQEDTLFVAGKQWDDAVVKQREEEGRPCPVINTLKKTTNLLDGYQRQNFTDPKVLPIENADDSGADCLNAILKWIMANNANRYQISYGFASASRGGIGWLFPEICFDRDMLNGEIKIKSISPMFVIPDPNSTDPMLEDAQRVCHFKFMDKEDVKSIYPASAAAIDGIQGKEYFQDFLQAPALQNHDKKLLVVERWYKKYVQKHVVILPTGDIIQIDGKDLQRHKDLQTKNPAHQIISRRVCEIWVMTSCDNVLLRDEISPYPSSILPFVPVWAEYIPEISSWKWRVQGIVRSMKDAQQGRNKARAVILEAAGKMVRAGYITEKGALDNPDVLKEPVPIIEVNPGKRFETIQGGGLDPAGVQLDGIFRNDNYETGPNPDLLGQQISKSEPGMNIQLRQKQGITAIQGYFDHLGMAKRNLCRLIIDLVMAKWDDTKIARITGKPVPESLADRTFAVYDVVCDETNDSPTYRAMTLESLLPLQQQGLQVDPALMIKLLPDVPEDAKQEMLKGAEVQKQIQMAGAELQLLQIQAQIAQIKAAMSAPAPGMAPGGDPSQPGASPAMPDQSMEPSPDGAGNITQ